MGSRGGDQSSRRTAPVTVAALIALLAAVAGSQAAQPGYEVSVGVMESDNIERLSTGGSRNTVLDQQLVFNWREQGPRLDANINADLMHLTYFPRIFPDQVIGNFLGDARFSLVPQMLFWDISDNFGQTNTDPLSAVTPVTRENINYFSTGPEALLPLGGSDNLLNVRATYGKVTYQKSPLDNQRFSGGVGLVHRLSPTSNLSFNVSDERIDYADNSINTDYSSQEAFARFDAKGSRTTLAADLGYGRLVETHGNSKPGQAVARFELSRKMSASSALSVAFGHEFSDSAGAFRVSQTLGGANLNTTAAVQTAAPFTTTFETVGWNFQRNRTGFGLSASHFKDAYQFGGDLNGTRWQGDANVSRQITPMFQVTLYEQYLRQIFDNVTGNSTESTTDARLTWRLGRRVSVFLDYMHAMRRSELANTAFTENRIWVSIGYGRPAQQLPGPATPPLPYSTTY